MPDMMHHGTHLVRAEDLADVLARYRPKADFFPLNAKDSGPAFQRRSRCLFMFPCLCIPTAVQGAVNAFHDPFGLA